MSKASTRSRPTSSQISAAIAKIPQVAQWLRDGNVLLYRSQMALELAAHGIALPASFLRRALEPLGPGIPPVPATPDTVAIDGVPLSIQRRYPSKAVLAWALSLPKTVVEETTNRSEGIKRGFQRKKARETKVTAKPVENGSGLSRGEKLTLYVKEVHREVRRLQQRNEQLEGVVDALRRRLEQVEDAVTRPPGGDESRFQIGS